MGRAGIARISALYLPTEEELRIEIERERALAVREQRAMYEVTGR
ncbi:MAG TPA: hypothetical protein VJH03_21495 [Blastocatellia bacterium]|nr:hypothetical protein [Blastocatellia bacterium]